jgi:hypothetical protein
MVPQVRIPAERHNDFIRRSCVTPFGDGPSFGDQEPRLRSGQVDNLPHVAVGEIDPVELESQFARKPHLHYHLTANFIPA